MSIDQAVLHTFIAECRERLQETEAILLSTDPGSFDREALNAVFRAAHTIKGAAGLFDLKAIVDFAHVMESVLDAVREGRVVFDAELVALLLSSCDHVGLLVDAVEAGRLEPEPALIAQGAPLVERLRRYVRAPAGSQREPAPARVSERDTPVDFVPAASAASEHWHISVRFARDALRNGIEPLSFLRYLEQLGSVVGLVTLFDAIPDAEQMDPEACYLGFEIALRSEATREAIEGVFELARDDCELRVLAPRSRVSQYLELIQGLPDDKSRLGEILVSCGSLSEQELEAALARQRAAPAPKPSLGVILRERPSVHPAVVGAALDKQQQIKEARAREARSIRVDADKLDHLINLVGELIISAAGTSLLARQAHLPELQQSTQELSQLVEGVRDHALRLRMVKIGATFQRFQRVVHDVSREVGKEIELCVSGEDTELDKTVIEKIGDPLLHLVRNAIDHGIEPPAVRAARGKPATGTLRLNAYHESGSIVIEVSDDGGGLNREKILDKALAQGLVEPGRSLSDKEIYGLIFQPGFSTADQVTSLSGRGVGMDVVKQNIAALRGGVSVSSAPERGTTVSVRVPLTLAVINGFLVGLGAAVFVIPLDLVEECIELSEPDRGYANLRGNVLPFIRLRELFSLRGAAAPRQNLVVVQSGGQRAGLLVDSLLGEFQTVIKPLHAIFNRVRCISGSTILGNGQVALILDVPALLQQAAESALVN